MESNALFISLSLMSVIYWIETEDGKTYDGLSCDIFCQTCEVKKHQYRCDGEEMGLTYESCSHNVKPSLIQ